MPVWFPPLDKLVTFIPEPPLTAGAYDDASFETPEGSLDGLDDDENFYEPADRMQDFGNTSMSFNDDDMMMSFGNDSMHFFDAVHDMDDLRMSSRYVSLNVCCVCGKKSTLVSFPVAFVETMPNCFHSLFQSMG